MKKAETSVEQNAKREDVRELQDVVREIDCVGMSDIGDALEEVWTRAEHAIAHVNSSAREVGCECTNDWSHRRTAAMMVRATQAGVGA